MEQEKYIQVGVTAMRDPATGGYLPAVPLYIKAEDSAQAGEDKLVEDLSKLFADRMRKYVEGCEAAGVPI